MFLLSSFPVLESVYAHIQVDPRTDFDRALIFAQEIKPVASFVCQKLSVPMQNHLANALKPSR